MGADKTVAVIGAGRASEAVTKLAYEVGREIGKHGAVLVCGGLTGVMEAAARGARESGGHTLGILPNYDRKSANHHIEFAIATGMGEARNVVVIATADAVIALDGAGGTLAEIGFALKLGRPVVALRAWQNLSNIEHAEEPAEAVELALRLANNPPAGTKDG